MKLKGKISLWMWKNFHIHEIKYKKILDKSHFKHIRFKKKESLYFEVGKKELRNCYKLYEFSLFRVGLRY